MDLVCTTLMIIRDIKSVPNSERKDTAFEYTYIYGEFGRTLFDDDAASPAKLSNVSTAGGAL